MRIQIEDKEYIITDNVMEGTLDFLLKIGLAFYDEKTPQVVQAGLEGLARAELYAREKKEPDKKEYFRPKKRESFVKHLAQIFRDDIANELNESKGSEGLKNQVIGFRINERNEIISIEFKDPSKTGGPLATGGNVRKWEDNSGKVP